MTIDKTDLLKIRADDFQANFFSMRKVEWELVAQVFVGYGAVAAAFAQVIAHGPPLLWKHLFTLGLVIVWGVWLYLGLRLQERMHMTRDTMNAYLKALHKEVGLDEIPPIGRTRHGRWYGFASQQVLSTTIALAIGIYVWTSPIQPVPASAAGPPAEQSAIPISPAVSR